MRRPPLPWIVAREAARTACPPPEARPSTTVTPRSTPEESGGMASARMAYPSTPVKNTPGSRANPGRAVLMSRQSAFMR